MRWPTSIKKEEKVEKSGTPYRDGKGNTGMCVAKHIFISNGDYCQDCGHPATADCHLPGVKIRFRYTTPVIIDEEPKWEDITEDCVACLTHSGKHDGFYVRISYQGKSLLILGLSKSIWADRVDTTKFKVMDIPGARFSFRIFRKVN